MLARSPVVLGGRRRRTGRTSQVLVNLGAELPAGFGRFERLIDIVSDDEADRRLARSRWRHYADRGYAITRHDFSRRPRMSTIRQAHAAALRADPDAVSDAGPPKPAGRDGRRRRARMRPASRSQRAESGRSRRRASPVRQLVRTRWRRSVLRRAV